MIRDLVRRLRREDGQALVLFAGGLVAFLGLVALSVDVGRFLWARGQMQSAVDAAVLAAAQSMPNGTSEAATYANQYWTDNSDFIRSQGENVSFAVSFPPGNKAVQINAQAEIPTWFAKIFGFDHWNVSASGTAASQVLDISVVLDISGSMCWGSYPPIDKGGALGPFGPYVGPGRTADQVLLTSAIPSGGVSSINISVNSTAIFNSTSSSFNNSKFGYSTTTRYYQYTPSNGRRGAIRIDNEVFLITAIPSATQLTVTRSQTNSFLGISTTKDAHAAGTALHSQHADCLLSAPSTTTGPWDPYQGMISNAQYFTTLFNSSYDKLGLISYSSQGTLRRNLSSNFSQIRSDMDAIVYPTGGTNSAHGIAVGRQVLDGSGKRTNAVRVLVFLTDGRANSYCGATYAASNYNSTSCPSQGGGNDGNSSAVNAANQEATRLAAGNDTYIYTIGFGPYVDDAFLQNIANIGHGQYYKAPTLAQLDDAFRAIAAETHIALTQ